MIEVTFQEPSDGGHEGFTQRARGPMLEELKGGKVMRVLMSDHRRSVMLVEASTDYHHVKWSKSQLRRFLAELESVVEVMTEPNPFSLDSTNLIAQSILLNGSDSDRQLARKLMTEGGYSRELIEMKIAHGERKAREAEEERRRREIVDIPRDAHPLKVTTIVLGTLLVAVLVGMFLAFLFMR